MALSFGTLVNYAANSIPTNAINGLQAFVAAFRLDQFAAPTASVGLNSQKITALGTGTAATDAATKGQMDTADSSTLSSAKSYADSGDSSTLASSKSYTDSAITSAKAKTKFATTITGDGSTATFTVNHQLGTADVEVSVFGPNGVVLMDFGKQDANNITLPFSPAPANGAAYRVIVWA